MQHRFAGGGTRPGGEIKQCDASFLTGFCFKLPTAIITRPAQIDDRLDAVIRKACDASRPGLIAAPDAIRDLMLIVPGQP